MKFCRAIDVWNLLGRRDDPASGRRKRLRLREGVNMIYTNDWLGNFTVRHGDRVTFTEPDCLTLTGKANGLLMFDDHLVLDMGGRHGTPRVVRPENITNVRKA